MMDTKHPHLNHERRKRVSDKLGDILAQIIESERLMREADIETPPPEIHEVINDLGSIRKHIDNEQVMIANRQEKTGKCMMCGKQDAVANDELCQACLDEMGWERKGGDDDTQNLK